MDDAARLVEVAVPADLARYRLPEEFGDDAADKPGIVRVNELDLVDGTAQHFGGRPAEHALGEAAPTMDDCFGIPLHDGQGGIRQVSGQLLVGPSAVLLGALQLGDVAWHAGEGGTAEGGIGHGRGTRLQEDRDCGERSTIRL